MLDSALLYGILDLKYTAPAGAEDMARRMVAGGVGILQLRAKDAGEDEIVSIARQLVPICREAGVPFILNDTPHLVADTGADGVHVGQEDVPVSEARRLAGEGRIIGKSTHSIAQAVAAQAEGPDYIGFGPLFATPTKPDYTPIGLAEIATVHERVSLPIFCIGGIKRENLAKVIAAGARRAVIVSGILLAEDPAGYARECLRMLG